MAIYNRLDAILHNFFAKDARMKPLWRASIYVLLFSCTPLALAAGFLWLHEIQPFDNLRLQPGGSVWQPNGVIVTPLLEQTNGLRAGDVVVAVDGRSMEDWARMLFQVRVLRPQWQIGETITYTVERDGHLVDLPVTLRRYPFGTIVAREWSMILFALVSFAIAVFVFLRRHTDAAARILFLWASSILAATTWSIGLHVGDIIGGTGFWLYKATTFGAYMLFWIAGLHFTLIFPHPHPLIIRHPSLITAIYTAPFVIVLVYLATSWPAAASVLDGIGQWGWIEGVLAAIYLAGMVIASFSQYRRSRGTVARQKIRWVVFATLISGGGGLCLWNIPILVLGRSIIDANTLGLLLLPIPVAIAIAIVRHQIFDIDTIINRTLVYGTLTAVLALVYYVSVVLLQQLFGALTGERSQLAIVASTLAIAVLFQPLRRHIHAAVDRRFFRHRYDAARVLAAFRGRVRDEVDLQRLGDDLLAVVEETMQPAQISLWVRKEMASLPPDR